LVIAPTLWLWSIESYWHVPQVRANLERLAQKRTVVQYDGRGQGTSSRDATDFSLDAYVSDLEAVIERLDSELVDVVAAGRSGIVGIAYAARHPDRVRRLALEGTAPRGEDHRLGPQAHALAALMDVNWELYVQTISLVLLGWTETARIMAETTSRDASRDTVMAGWRALRQADVSALLPAIRCPTLVAVPDTEGPERTIPTEVSRELAAAIKNARLVTYAGAPGFILAGENCMRIIEEFLDEDEPRAGSELPSGTAVILFADIADSTALTERLGDAAFRKKARELDGALRSAIREHSGTPVEGKLLGDGVLAVFTSAREAIEAAVRCRDEGNRKGLPLHLGIHAGDVIRERDPDGRDNVYGGAVNVASRIAGLSAAGEVLVSETVRSLARTSAGVGFEDRGEQALKGVGEAVRVWAVREGEDM
jgi:class 3 adenylate cyclase